MLQKRDRAIVLRSVTFEERHRVITALTEQHGRISAMARNSIQSRRFGGALEPFAASEWLFVEKPNADLYRIESAEIRRSFEGLRKNFENLTLASIFNELMLRLAPEREPCPELFKLHSNALAYLEELSNAQPDAPGGDPVILNGYLAKVLQWSGNQPQIQACLSCERPLETLEPHQAISCLVADAGWICPDCRSSDTHHVRGREGSAFHHSLLRVTPAALTDFLQAMSMPIRQVPSAATASRQEHRALFAYLEALMVYHVPGFDKAPMKSLRMLELDRPVGQFGPPAIH